MIELTGHSLTLEAVEAVANDRVEVSLGRQARVAIIEARGFVRRLLETGEKIYGVTTGFGRLADVVIAPNQQVELQRNLIRSHSAGVGDALSCSEVRTILLLRANALCRGHSGCRVEVVERLIEMLNHGIHPVVPEMGSVGASGDLAPLAHIALTILGEGFVLGDGSPVASADALAAVGLEPMDLREKEGLALINGTQAHTGLGVLALRAAERALEAIEVAGAMSLDALKGTPEAFREEVQAVRPHAGQAASARRLWSLLLGSEIRESHRIDDPRVQDAYSLRCMPQVHGAGRSALAYVRGVVEVEVNSSTDNPLIFPEAGVVVSAGNFHGQIVAQALDFLTIAITDLASISERRIERLLNPDLSGLPAFLTTSPGLSSGLMIAQVTAVDLLAEMRVLAHPVSTDSVPTSASQEDHVSMGMAAARKARRAVRNLEYVVAMEFLAAAQAIEFHRPLKSGPPIEAALALIRERVPRLEDDRSLTGDMESIADLVRSGVLGVVA
ncbi:MAG: histidine ammonia-lyase [Gemmatimonadota bacterium]|nr:MAG: histidine ammonia-lyase [Gemmatimonadota bacterium]